MKKSILLQAKEIYFFTFKMPLSKFLLCFFIVIVNNNISAQGLCDSFTLSYSATSPTCNGMTNGTINLNMSGGTAPYTFNWSNGSIAEDLSGLSASTYSVIVTDQNGCMDTAYVNITQPAPLLNTITVQHVLCNGGNTGFIYTNVTGGTVEYNYFWSNGFTSPNLIYMSAGTYILTVVDYLGCNRKDTVQILQPPPINLTLFSPEPIVGYNISTYLGNDGSIDLTVSGGVYPYAYLWSNSATTEDLSYLTANTYSVTVTDSNLCTASASILLDQPGTIEMPTGFTPNSDGKNDNFIIHGIEGYENNVLTIFNRWGNIVYQKENYNNQWNGYNNKGSELPDGTYFAILEIKTNDIILKGYVEMKRH